MTTTTAEPPRPDGQRRGDRRARDHPPRRAASRPELKEGIRGTLVLAVLASLGQVVVPIAVQQTLDRGLNGPGGPDVRFTVLMGLVAAVAIVVTSIASYAMTSRLFTASERGPRDAADQGVPPRPRPAAADPEHRAPRRPGRPGHQRRRPGQPVPRLRRPDLRRQRRADAGRHGDHADLQLAARDRGVGLLRAAVPVAALLPAQALRRLRHRAPPGRAPAVGHLRAGGGRRGRPLLRRRGPHPGAASTTRSRRHKAASTRAQGFTAFSFSLGGISAGLANAGVLIVGIWLGFAGDITAGKVLAFAFLVTLFVGPVQMGTQILTDAQNAIAGWRRVIGILETPADLVDPGPGRARRCRAGRSTSASRTSRSPTRPGRRCCATSPSRSPPAPGSRSWGRPARASPRSPSC